ncbi:MAG: Gfo/Idh/MocA family oxidoreductase [Leptospirales bacterium]
MGIRFGVVGVGYLGQHHARVLTEIPGIETVSVFDEDESRAREVASRLQVPVRKSLAELVRESDAVSIVTPTLTHTQIVSEILSQGSPHLFLEKPISDTVENAEKILSLVREKNVLLQVGHIERFNPGLEAIIESNPRPAYIEAQRLSSFGIRGTDVPVVVDLMIHDIDIILTLVKSPIQTIRVVGTPVITPHIDIANAWIEFENGCLAQVLSSRVSLEKLRKFRVFDREGRYFSLNFDTRELSEAKVTLNPGSLPRIERGKRMFEAEEPLKKELKSFVSSILSGTPVKVTGEDAFEALKVALEVNRLAEESLKRFQQMGNA